MLKFLHNEPYNKRRWSFSKRGIKKTQTGRSSKNNWCNSSAREFGDLKENAEYHAAKEQQSLTEARIRDIESKLSTAQVIDISTITPSDKVIFGTTITVFNSEQEKSLKYKIVGEDEADASKGKISFASPLARQLIGKFEGDLLKVETPGGQTEYEIEKVEYI